MPEWEPQPRVKRKCRDHVVNPHPPQILEEMAG